MALNKPVNTRDIEQAFNELIAELQHVKDLNNISADYKKMATEYSKHVASLFEKLEAYYLFSKERDLWLKTTLDDSIKQLSLFEENRTHSTDRILNEQKDHFGRIDSQQKNAVKDIKDDLKNVHNTINESQKELEKQLTSSFDEIKTHSTDRILSEQKDHFGRIDSQQKNAIKEIKDDFRDIHNIVEESKTELKEQLIEILTRNHEWQERKLIEANDQIASLSKGVSFLKIATIILLLTTSTSLILSFIL